MKIDIFTLLETFWHDFQNEIIGTLISLAVFYLIRFIISITVRRVAKISGINYVRSRLVIRYITFFLFAILIFVLVLVWGVDFHQIVVIVSSTFALLGVVLFAQWSILSNITAGVILFFYFPYKIGDRIRIQDKDFPAEAVIINIKGFNIILMKDNGEVLIYPNNLILQKGVVLVQKQAATKEDFTADF